MEWIEKHSDTVLVLGALFTGFLWLNGKFNDLDRRLVRIETILVMNGIMHPDLAAHSKDDK